MSELIDRQQAIDAAIEAADDWDGGCNIGRQKRIENYLKRLPSALGTNLAEVGTDCISRQAAIDELVKMLGYCFQADEEVVDAVVTTVRELPSAQPEIVRCGECKHLMPNGRCEEFADYLIKPSASDFCSYGERGEWTT